MSLHVMLARCWITQCRSISSPPHLAVNSRSSPLSHRNRNKLQHRPQRIINELIYICLVMMNDKDSDQTKTAKKFVIYVVDTLTKHFTDERTQSSFLRWLRGTECRRCWESLFYTGPRRFNLRLFENNVDSSIFLCKLLNIFSVYLLHCIEWQKT